MKEIGLPKKIQRNSFPSGTNKKLFLLFFFVKKFPKLSKDYKE